MRSWLSWAPAGPARRSALLDLAEAGQITLKPGKDTLAGLPQLGDVEGNPKNYQSVQVPIGQLARIRDMAWVLEGANRVVGTAEEIADRLEEWREAGVDGINVYHATVPGSFQEVADRLFPTLRERGLIVTDKSGTLRHKLLGRGDRLPDSHPAAAYRGAFGDNDLLNNVGIA